MKKRSGTALQWKTNPHSVKELAEVEKELSKAVDNSLSSLALKIREIVKDDIKPAQVKLPRQNKRD
jgi:hypothetical protein